MELPEIMKMLPPMTKPPIDIPEYTNVTPAVATTTTMPEVQVGTRSSVLEFQSPDEFIQFMKENPSKFTAVNTRILNNTYKIPGYVIRQNRERTQLTLVSEFEANRYKKPKQDDQANQAIQELNQRLDELNDLLAETRTEVVKMKNMMKPLINTLNTHSKILSGSA